MLAKVVKALNGWKYILGSLAYLGALVWDHYHNGSAGNVVAAVLATLGWMPEGIDFSKAVPSIVALVGLGHVVYKAHKEHRAGAKLSELRSPEGAVKLAMSNGTVWQMIDDAANAPEKRA